MITALEMDHRSLAARVDAGYRHRGWWFRYLVELAMVEALLGGAPAKPVGVLTDELAREPLRPGEAYALDRNLTRLRRVLAARDLAVELPSPTPAGTAPPSTDPVRATAALFGLDAVALRSLARAALRILPDLYAHVADHPVDWGTAVTGGPDQATRIRELAGRHVAVVEVAGADLLFRRWHELSPGRYVYLLDPTRTGNLLFHCQHLVHDGGHLRHLNALATSPHRGVPVALPRQMLVGEAWAMADELTALVDSGRVEVRDALVHAVFERFLRVELEVRVRWRGQRMDDAVAAMAERYPRAAASLGDQLLEFAGLPGFGLMHVAAMAGAAEFGCRLSGLGTRRPTLAAALDRITSVLSASPGPS
ncbi:hypothetical protein [Micromonospora echinospora]|uniref:hypothetical protein n=1 Tax=Micromonospora echinospora TaxID=1877 RepID=UPI003672563F